MGLGGADSVLWLVGLCLLWLPCLGGRVGVQQDRPRGGGGGGVEDGGVGWAGVVIGRPRSRVGQRGGMVVAVRGARVVDVLLLDGQGADGAVLKLVPVGKYIIWKTLLCTVLFFLLQLVLREVLLGVPRDGRGDGLLRQGVPVRLRVDEGGEGGGGGGDMRRRPVVVDLVRQV